MNSVAAEAESESSIYATTTSHSKLPLFVPKLALSDGTGNMRWKPLRSSVDHTEATRRKVKQVLRKKSYKITTVMVERLEGEEQQDELVELLHSLDLLLPFIRKGMSEEVRNTAHSETLFRESNPMVRLVSSVLRHSGSFVMLKLKAGFRAYAIRTLNIPLGLKYGETPAEGAGKVLGDALAALLDLMERYHPMVPFLPVMGIVHDCVRAKFPTLGLRGVGAFVFLRWLTPYITGLEFGSGEKLAHENALQVSKALQKLANETLFDDSHPLHVVNPYIEACGAQRLRLLRMYSGEGLNEKTPPLFPDVTFNSSFLCNYRPVIASALAQSYVYLMPEFLEVMLELEVAEDVPEDELLALPKMDITASQPEKGSNSARIRQEKLSRIADEAPRETIKALISDQATIIHKMKKQIDWLENALAQSRAANAYIRDSYRQQLSVADRILLEKALAIRQQDDAEPKLEGKAMLRSLSSSDLHSSELAWDTKTMRRQIVRICSSLSEVTHMKHTIALLLRCPRCDAAHPNRARLLEHYTENCELLSSRPLVCKYCDQTIGIDQVAFQAHVNSCERASQALESSLASKKTSGSKITRRSSGIFSRMKKGAKEPKKEPKKSHRRKFSHNGGYDDVL